MLWGLLVAVVAPTVIILCRTGYYSIIRNSFERQYNDWKRLNHLVSMRETNSAFITLISAKIVLATMYLSIVQYLNNSVRKVGKHDYEISYVVSGRMYKMLVTPVRGRHRVSSIRNDNNINITNIVRPYLGPKYDWHGMKFTPEFFGSSSLTFEMCDGSVRVVDGIIPHLH